MELDPSKIDPRHLKISFPKDRDGMSRRELLFGFLRPSYEIVPAVEKERCVAWRGCSVCVGSCPQEAMSLEGESASINKDKCTACGACLPSCPVDAISSPLLDPEVLDASLRSLLCRDNVDKEPRVVLIVSEDASTLLTTEGGSLPPQLRELKLPCIGALSPWLLLRSFDLGADGVAVIPCGPNCRHRCQPGRWQWGIKFVQAVLGCLGMEVQRLRLFSQDGEPQTLSGGLAGFAEQIKEFGPSRFGEEKRKTETSLSTLLQGFKQRLNLDGASLSGEEVSFGFLRVETGDKTCTLCGACSESCPTGAIALREEAGLSGLRFHHSRCMACEECVKVCPELVLRMEKRLDFSLLGETTILAEDRMALCRSCGCEIAPLTMLRKIQDQLAGKKIGGLAAYCPNCRIFGLSDGQMAVNAGDGFADVERERGKI